MTHHVIKIVDLISGQNVDLLTEVFKLRYRIFIQTLNWNMPADHEACIEFDQYDTPHARHICYLENSKLVASMRVLSTGSVFSNGQTYMILDAHRGRLSPNLPRGILWKEIQDSETWEASRLALDTSIKLKDKNRVIIRVIKSALEYVKNLNGSSLIGMMHPAFERVLRRGGIAVERIGPICDQEDGRICVLRSVLQVNDEMCIQKIKESS